jgi:FkbM family methyltransferase
MIIKTKTKIALARNLYRTLKAMRLAAQPGIPVQVRREGILWSLDLGEGIDFAIYLLGAFERSTRNILRGLVKSGNTVFDIGANVGAHTLHLAKAVGPSGKVYAFEATNFAFEKLMLNIALNPELKSRIFATQVLLADDLNTGHESHVYSSWPLEASTNPHPKHLGVLQSTSKARIETLDNFITENGIGRVDIIKIDVDGHEYPVLKGAQKLFQAFSPTIIMELSPYVHSEQGNNFDDLINLLKELGYEIRSGGKTLPLDAQHLREVIPDGSGINVVAAKTYKSPVGGGSDRQFGGTSRPI